MDGNRFDNWARSRAQKLTRRKAVAVAGATGIAAAMTKVLPSSAQAGVTCEMSIQALTSAGPSFGTAYSGVLEITIVDEGPIDVGSLSFDGGPTVPVVGQADGRALSLRATFPNGNALVLTGTGEQPIDLCTGALSGVFGGPELGDTGSWLIDPSQSVRTENGGSGSGIATGTAVPGSSPTPSCPGVTCDSTYVVDPVTCECVCPPPFEMCGEVCCPSGSDCTDPASGTCSCPMGTELCGDSCVPLCGSGEYLDYDTCQCSAGCNLTCSYEQGKVLDETTCTCVDVCTGTLPYFCGGACYEQQMYLCSGACYTAVSLNSNANMCGPSCQACPAGVPCIAGTCQCPFGYSYCQGVGCKSLSDDNSNCGACGNVCSAGTTCQGGMCQQ